MEDATRAVQALQGHRLVGSSFPLVVRFADNAEIKAKKQAKHISSVIAGPLPSSGLSRQHQHQHPHPVQHPHPHYPMNMQHHPMMQQQQQQQSSSPRFNPYGNLSTAASVAAAMAPPGPSGPQIGMQSPFGPSAYYGGGPPPQGVTSGYMGQHHPGHDQGGYFSPGGSGGPSGTMDPYGFQRLASAGSGGNLAGGMGAGGAAGPGGPSGSGGGASLYVKNLPVNADRLFLYEKFAPFGAVLSVKVCSTLMMLYNISRPCT